LQHDKINISVPYIDGLGERKEHGIWSQSGFKSQLLSLLAVDNTRISAARLFLVCEANISNHLSRGSN
jgi:hypothetical protein